MTLKYQIDTLDGVAENLRTLYKEQDGKFVLDVSGVESTASVQGLKSALEKERANNQAYSSLGSPDDITARIGQLETDLKAKPKGDVDHEAIITQLKKEHATEIDGLKSSLTGLRSTTATSEFKALLAKQDVLPEGQELLASVVRDRITFSDDGSLRVLNAQGQPMVGSGADATATLGDLATEVAAKYPQLVRDPGKGGGGKQPSDGGKPTNQKTIGRTQFDGMSQSERSDFSKEGGKVVAET